ncbi:MAG TPA: FtsX-like permease family protein [Bacteroidota bacterium]|nr:FtsX-like permease family protein [Bacteroidota bacterium]
MIKFLLKGLLRDRSRSLFPFLTVMGGVILTVVLHAWMNGVSSSLIESTAHFSTGHVRVMTRAYAKEADQVPNDLALLGIDTLMHELRDRYRDLFWVPRTKFGGLLDIPDQHGETKTQTPVSGLAIDLLSPGSPEWKLLNIKPAIVHGRVPSQKGEILIGEDLAEKLRVQPGDTATLISSTMYGSMSVTNFAVAGTVRFGVVAMDKGMVLADIGDIQQALDMQQGAGEILGFFNDDLYRDDRANAITVDFNGRNQVSPGDSLKKDPEFSPIMGTLRSQGGLSDYLDLVDEVTSVVIGFFVVAMSVVLWNAGLTGSLRRYGEIGVRLAVGEDKTHVYLSLLAESLTVGLLGSLFGTAIGLSIAYYGQVKGLNLSSFMKESTMFIPSVVRAQITGVTVLLGFFPGMLATFLGTAISGIGIYKRNTSELFKELDA